MTDSATSPTTQAVILARGLGTRMRTEAREGVPPLNTMQAEAADSGAKGMMPFARPFLDYVVSALADAGVTDVVFVVGPENDQIREYYSVAVIPTRVRVQFAVQGAPRGTADAVYAARDAVRDAPFLVLNSDNLYPPAAFSDLAALGAPGLVAFEADALVRESGIEPERVMRFALVDTDADGFLRTIREKPALDDPLARSTERWVSMNLWSFTPTIFQACVRVLPSSRGELELADAVMIAISDLGERFRVLPMRAGVLDLSSRADVALVASRLAGITPRT